MTNVTCELTAKKPGSASCQTLAIEYGATFLYMLTHRTFLVSTLLLLNLFFGGTRHLIRIVIIVSDEVHGRRQELLEGYFNCPFLASQYILFILSLSFFLSLLFPSAPLRRSRPLLNQLGSLGSAVSSVGGVRD